MRLRNRENEAVDAVPFAVVVAAGFLVTFSFGPGYLLALGLELPAALGLSGLCFGLVVAGAYHRLVWTARTDLGMVDAASRFERLLYWALITGLVLVGLSFPFW